MGGEDVGRTEEDRTSAAALCSLGYVLSCVSTESVVCVRAPLYV